VRDAEQREGDGSMARASFVRVVAAPVALLIVLASLAMATGVSLVQAQGAGDLPHPAHIHSGSCAELGDIVYPLQDVALATAGETFGSASAVPVEQSETDVEASLSDILAAPHAVNIHQSADAIQIYIACGDIGGRVIDGKLLIGLQEIDGSGYHGIAVLDGSDADETEVSVYLANGSAPAATEQAAAAPAAATETPAAAAPATSEATAAATLAPIVPPTATTAAAPAAQEVPIDIRDLAFSPDQVEIAVGDTVTWTNQDQVPHTATSNQQGVFQSGTITPGSSFSHTFTEAGEFPYHCEFHPNMSGTIVVR
jgi:plastocyanin